jgi:hypothetical protein
MLGSRGDVPLDAWLDRVAPIRASKLLTHARREAVQHALNVIGPIGQIGTFGSVEKSKGHRQVHLDR